MFGAPRWLQEHLNFSKDQSMIVFDAWCKYKQGK
jgi:hypothetical protein